MDTSPEYVKMCTAAAEIQESRPLRDPLSFGDVFCCPTHGVIILGMMAVGLCCGTLERPTKKVWLPRQDQLQEMVGGSNRDTLTKLVSLMSWVDPMDLPNISDLPWEASLEQLWLCFVMLELYQKRWNGAVWINV